MKSGRTIQEMAAEIQRQDEAKADYVVDTRHMHMEIWNNQPYLRVLDGSGDDLLEPLEIQTTAHRQISTYLNIPLKYYEKMRLDDPDLLAHNVNRWLQRNQPAPRMLRTLDGQARAFLSSRYRRISHYNITGIVTPVVGEMPDIQFGSCELTQDYMYLKVVNPRLQDEVRPGDIVQAGVAISNSETGQGAVNVCPLIYRLVCTNGMTAMDNAVSKMRRTHAGPRIITNDHFFVCDKEELTDDDQDFVSDLQAAVRDAMDEAKFVQLLNQMRASAQMELNAENLSEVVSRAAACFKITETESDGILQHLHADGDYTLYGLANAVTRYSQDVESYDRASKLEGIGYTVMTMAPELFRRINQVSSIAA